MADWDISSAINSLRSLLGDAGTDKYAFKVDCVPAPDGITTRFFAGQTRLIEDTLAVYQNGVEIAPSGVSLPDPSGGLFDLLVAPSGGMELQASYYYRWFHDAELEEFLQQGSQTLAFTGVDDPALTVGIRAVVLDLACYYAYMRKATEYADSLVASAAGYTADQSRSHPNWRGLAQQAWDTAQKRIDMLANNPLSDNAGMKPGMRFVAFVLPTYVPKS